MVVDAKFKTAVLIGRQHTLGVVDTLKALIDYLRNSKVKIFLESDTSELLPGVTLPIVGNDLLNNQQHELIIVVGGDGSLLHAAHIAADKNIPVLGINRGTLGFLTDIKPDAINSIDKILQGDYSEEERFLLNATVQNEVTGELALNDVVLLPSAINRMMEFSVYINGQFVCWHKADGMIVATPTGSTAHALAGGGPILHPNLDAIVLLPMFPHTLSSRPIVVSGDSNIEIVMAGACNVSPNVSCDGQKLIPVPIGGTIKIKKHGKKLRLIHLTDYNYFETLRYKLNWEAKNKC
jgi:NAD+ kinase